MADGNPRLLEWLDKILQVEDLEHDKILQEMGKVEQKFREDVVAEVLINQQPVHLKQLLSLASVFRLPVPKVAIKNSIRSVNRGRNKKSEFKLVHTGL
ncbi:hypothetical protein [Nostoc sp. C052]|uniref:hypothetical protein n=1 Tax=Nostoc sp. C052 TaxID=2576902 RepID=UPI00211744A0|nr:hypothetical protein [Nostoc sp. C052]